MGEQQDLSEFVSALLEQEHGLIKFTSAVEPCFFQECDGQSRLLAGVGSDVRIIALLRYALHRTSFSNSSAWCWPSQPTGRIHQHRLDAQVGDCGSCSHVPSFLAEPQQQTR
mmetsp:Transcript_74433/g.193441  ORF Transcript_74433/g.193441 Transcript_74433/m.193441 type:complete len:112 (+) Transcript_74433:1087-1422(+)